MNWTFGIVTYSGHGKLGKSEQARRIRKILKSIRIDVPEDNHEVIIVGDYIPEMIPPATKIVAFDEARRSGWITRKKNIITEQASFENIVYMHDYFCLQPGFYKGWKLFGYDWDVGMNVIMNSDDTRYRDWCIWDDPDYGPPWLQKEPFCGVGKYRAGYNRIAPYDYKKTQFMYISGGYWVAKKTFMKQFPLDERWGWGQAE